MKLTTPVENIKRIGPTYARRLKKLGIKEVKDLLFHFPSRYEDYSEITPVAQLQKGMQTTVRGKVTGIRERWTSRRNLKIIEAFIEDDTASIKAVWFNQQYIKDALSTQKPVMLSGKVGLGKDGLYLNNPIYEVASLGQNPVHTGRLVPIYPETAGVSSRWLRYIIARLLPLVKNVEETLPSALLKQKGLLGIQDALAQIHFPKNFEMQERARYRFSFEDIFLIQLAALKTKYEIRQSNSPKIKTNVALTKKFVSSLPYTLTDSQKKATWQILKDMERSFPMNRLLEGDVGSGKTVVAVIAALNAINAGYQVAFMAPTEILAEQHHKTITSLMSNFKIPTSNKSSNPKSQKIKIALFTRSHQKTADIVNPGFTMSVEKLSKEKIKNKISNGEVNFIIGTHALTQEKVEFFSEGESPPKGRHGASGEKKGLGLVVLDEQHRFGVKQRATLVKKSKNVPHLLSMTATPIPRSLALTIYGDLDISLLREMPRGRKKIITRIVPPAKRKEAYDFIKKELDKGRQAFVVFPLVEDSEKLEVRSAKAEYEKLKKGPFKKYKVGLLYGKLKAKEKQDIMTRMKEGKIDILISSSVVEVGIDIPNATIMMIDGADRFGLAQLHQFRGRVGRSEHQSYAFLLSESNSQSVVRRLSAIKKASNGFELAQYDLKLRGAGDMYGVRQSGMPDIAMQALGNLELIEEARENANKLLEKDTSLQTYPLLKKTVEKMQKTMHFE